MKIVHNNGVIASYIDGHVGYTTQTNSLFVGRPVAMNAVAQVANAASTGQLVNLDNSAQYIARYIPEDVNAVAHGGGFTPSATPYCAQTYNGSAWVTDATFTFVPTGVSGNPNAGNYEWYTNPGTSTDEYQFTVNGVTKFFQAGMDTWQNPDTETATITLPDTNPRMMTVFYGADGLNAATLTASIVGTSNSSVVAIPQTANNNATCYCQAFMVCAQTAGAQVSVVVSQGASTTGLSGAGHVYMQGIAFASF